MRVAADTAKAPPSEQKTRHRGGSMVLLTCPQFVLLGQIKIMGMVEQRLKTLALCSMRRLIMTAEMMGFGFSETTQKMLEDLESFQNPSQPTPTETAQTPID